VKMIRGEAVTHLCIKHAQLISVIFGAVLAVALIVPTMLMSETPCNDVVMLTSGEQAVCSAPGWAGRGTVVLYPAENTSAYLFDDYPAVSSETVDVEHFNQTMVPSGAFKYLSYWLLRDSVLSCELITDNDGDFYVFNSTNFKAFKEEEDETKFESLFSAKNTTWFNFTYLFNSTNDIVLDRFFVVVSNKGEKDLEANITTHGTFTQFNVSNAVQSCHGEEKCTFDSISENQTLLTVVHGNFSIGITSVAMGWTYSLSTTLPVVIIIAAISVIVAIIITISIIVTLVVSSKTMKSAGAGNNDH